MPAQIFVWTLVQIYVNISVIVCPIITISVIQDPQDLVKGHTIVCIYYS